MRGAPRKANHDTDSADNGVSRDETEIELDIHDTLGPKPKAGWDSSQNQGKNNITFLTICLTIAGNIALLTGMNKDDNEEVNRIFQATGTISIRGECTDCSPSLTLITADPSTGRTDEQRVGPSKKRRKNRKTKVSFSEPEATGNSFRGEVGTLSKRRGLG